MVTTHQSLSGSTDEEFVQRMASTYGERFGADFWAFFTDHVAPSLPPRPVIIDLGCGPGLLLRDLGEHYPQATLYGYDVTPAMIAHGQQLSSKGAKPTLALHDVGTQPLPNATGSVHLVTMTSVLHIVDEPLLVLAEIRRVLAPGGIFFSMTGSAPHYRPIWLHALTGPRPPRPIVCAGFASFPPTISTP